MHISVFLYLLLDPEGQGFARTTMTNVNPRYLFRYIVPAYNICMHTYIRTCLKRTCPKICNLMFLCFTLLLQI